MWARVSRFELAPDRIDEDIRDSKRAVTELLDRTQGLEGVYYLVDRESGRTMAITLWDSEESMRASEHAASQVREQSTQRVGGKVVAVEHYEVALQPSEVAAAMR